jgi:hypothetical protein
LKKLKLGVTRVADQHFRLNTEFATGLGSIFGHLGIRGATEAVYVVLDEVQQIVLTDEKTFLRITVLLDNVSNLSFEESRLFPSY